MHKFYRKVIRFRIPIMAAFFILGTACFFLRQMVSVDYDMNDYLPSGSPSTAALDRMEEEFGGSIPNARVMVKNVSVKEALDYKKQLEAVDGVESVSWLDDVVDIYVPLSMYDEDTVEKYYRDDTALFTVTIEEDRRSEAVSAIRKIIGDNNCMTGSAVSTAEATKSTVSQIRVITIAAVIFTFLVLMLTTQSWTEPLIVLIGLGIAILINSGSNLIFGTISFVTNAAGSILQLAVSLDYSVFLIHRFEECRQTMKPEEAMEEALVKSTSSILSSGLTTVIGFLALILMQFRIGPDMGLALAKGIAISLLTVFLFMPGLILCSWKLLDRTKHKSLLPDFHRLGNLVVRVMVPISVVMAAAVVPSYILSTKNSYYYGSSHIFKEGTQYGDDTAEIQKLFGKNDTYVLMVPVGDDRKERELAEAVSDLEGVSGVTDITTILGPAVPADILPGGITGSLESENYRRMIISVNADYEGEGTFTLVEQIRKTAEKYYPGTYDLAGEGVSTYDLMDTITGDMTKVNLVAIAAVFLILLVTMKNFVLPMILVSVIETAVWINFTIPYLTGQSVFYIAYLIISSIQLGATVDYAILVTERYRESRRSMDRKPAVKETISSCTASILTSGTVMTVVGLLLGKISTHGVLSQLGTFLGIGTLLSMGMVLFVLPGLLYLFDRAFIRRKKI
jgi:predicted RND superfamily exporter protein